METRPAPLRTEPPHSPSPLADARARLSRVLDEIEVTTVEDSDRAFELAVEVEAEATVRGEEDLRLRALLVRTDVEGRRGHAVAVAPTLRWVNRWATENGHQYLLARSHRLLAIFFGVLGDDVASLEHALRAVELLDDTMCHRLHADHLLGLAMVQARTGSPEAGRRNLATAEEIAVAGGHWALLGRIVNNLSYLEHLAGEHERAMCAAERLLDILAEHDVAIVPPQVDTVARAYLEVGRYREAELILHHLLEDTADLDRNAFTDPEGNTEVLLTLAEVQRRRGDTDIAEVTLQRCLDICDARSLSGVRVRVRLERAKLYAAMQRFRDAYVEMTAYVEESQQLNTDTRSRIVATLFEAEEARRASDRYQEMAHRDFLTGLHNRRHADARLPQLLDPEASGGGSLSVAFIDLDHFKRINDTLSHEVGDAVLRQFGQLLSAAVEDRGFAARMGGEEFLLVLPEADPLAARALCARLQHRIRQHDWSEITGSLPVRASIGLSTAPVDGRTTQAALLADADERLYAAKSAGRDRIVAGLLGQPVTPDGPGALLNPRA